MSASNSIYESIQEKGESTFISHFFSIVVNIFYLDTTSQCKKRWVDVSSPSPHITHNLSSSESNTLGIARLAQVGNLSRRMVQEKDTILDWARLFQRYRNIIVTNLTLRLEARFPQPTYMWTEPRGFQYPRSPHHHTSSSSKPLNPPNTSNKLLIKSISQLKGSLRQRSLQITQSSRLSHLSSTIASFWVERE